MAYKKNYLDKVIFQLRFDPVLALESAPPATFQKKIHERFPKPTEGHEFEARISLAESCQTNVNKVRPRWTFTAADGSRSVTVSSRMFSLEYSKYENIDVTKDDFRFLWAAFSEEYQIDTLARVGLRYVDKIVCPGSDPLQWEGWIAKPLLDAVFAMSPPDGHDWSRSMHALHWVGDDHRIAFQFGIFNAQAFPSAVARSEFILDTDCVSLGSVDAQEVEACLDKYKDLLKTVFEDSIDEDLRRDMNA